MNTISEIKVSKDQNTVTVMGIEHMFEEGKPETKPCQECSLIDRCIQLQETVWHEFPFPCAEESRDDGKFGNFKRKEPLTLKGNKK